MLCASTVNINTKQQLTSNTCDVCVGGETHFVGLLPFGPLGALQGPLGPSGLSSLRGYTSTLYLSIGPWVLELLVLGAPWVVGAR